MRKLSYLHVRGTLLEDMTFTPRRIFESARPGAREPGDERFALVLLDRDGNELLAVAPQVAERCGPGDRPQRAAVRGAIPLRPEAASLELRAMGRTIHRESIAAEPPSTPKLRMRTAKNGVGFDLESKPERTTTTHSIVLRSAGGKRITVARGVKDTFPEIDFGSLPIEGKATVLVVADDGGRTAEAEVAEVDIPRRPSEAHILSPAPGETLPFGQPLSASGCNLDFAGDPLPGESAEWQLDGEPFATGSLTVAAEGLEPGEHKLTLAVGSEGERVEATILFKVEEPDDDHRNWLALVDA